MKAVKLIAVLAILAVAAVVVSKMTNDDSSSNTSVQQDREKATGGVALEEKYGFTSQQAGG